MRRLHTGGGQASAFRRISPETAGKRILLFGHGQFYERRKKALRGFLGTDCVIGFLDNAAMSCRVWENLPVYLPAEVVQLAYDRIVLMSAYLREMREQLIELGVPSERILFYEAYRAERTRGHFSLPSPSAPAKGKQRILIVTHDLNYDGGSLAAVHAAQAFLHLGHVVTLAAPSAATALAGEVHAAGVSLVLCPTIPYLGEREMMWMRQYDVILVNVFPNYPVAMKMRSVMPVLWWLHEASARWSDIYPRIRYQFTELEKRKIEGIHVLAVSPVAAAAFHAAYPGVTVGILPFGIPDRERVLHFEHARPIFALIGGICALKAQWEFLQAVSTLLETRPKLDAEFWLIGSEGTGIYGRETQALVERIPQACWKGVLTRQEMVKAYQQIDVVVCASREETMSSVIVEGLMQGIVCLTTKSTGAATYLIDGVNGFLAEDSEPEHLAAALERVLACRKDWPVIGARGRDVYEREFSMQRFGERLQREIETTIETFHKEKGKNGMAVEF